MKYLKNCNYCNEILHSHWKNPRFDKCRDCDLLIRNPFPSEQDLNILYENAWEQPDEETYEMGITNSFLSDQYVKEILKTINLNDLSGKKILDFGAGKGYLMKALESVGADVVGVEPFGYSFLKKKGFNVYKTLSDIPNSEGFDGIITMEVFEHLRQPWIELKSLHSLMNPNSWIIISCPNPKSLNAIINGDKWNQANYMGHIVFPSTLTLKKMLSNIGFTKADSIHWKIKYNDSKTKSLLHIILQKIGFDGAIRVIGWK